MEFQKKLFITIFSLTLLLVAWIAVDFKEQEVPFISVEDLIIHHNEFSQKRFRLGGHVDEGSIKRSDDLLTVFFRLKQGQHLLPVEYSEVALPDLFKDGAEVIVEGAYDNGTLKADNLMTKCASRYEEEANYKVPGTKI